MSGTSSPAPVATAQEVESDVSTERRASNAGASVESNTTAPTRPPSNPPISATSVAYKEQVMSPSSRIDLSVGRRTPVSAPHTGSPSTRYGRRTPISSREETSAYGSGSPFLNRSPVAGSSAVGASSTTAYISSARITSPLLRDDRRDDIGSSNYISGSAVERVHRREVSRIEQLFDGTKVELQRAGEELRMIEDENMHALERTRTEAAREIDRLTQIVEDLRDRLRLADDHRRVADEQRAIIDDLRARLADADELKVVNEELRGHLRAADNIRDQLREANETRVKTSSRVAGLEAEVVQRDEKIRSLKATMDAEIAHRDERLRALKASMDAEVAQRDEKIRSLRASVDHHSQHEATIHKMRSEHHLTQADSADRETQLKGQLRRLQTEHADRTATDTRRFATEMADKEADLRRIQSLLETRSKQLHDKTEEVERLSRQMHEITTDRRSALARSSADIQDKEHALKSMETRAMASEEQHRALREDAQTLSAANDQHLETIHRLKIERDTAVYDVTRVKTELQQAVDEVNVLTDNARLAKLLYSTGQFTDFFRYNAEYNGIVYVPPSPASHEDLTDAPITYSAHPDRPIIAGTEWKHWVPQDAMELGRAFQNRYLTSVRTDLFAELLLQLNQVWRRRETLKINQLKAKHAEDLRNMRRILSQRIHYEDVIQLDRLSHLKQELKRAQSPQAKRLSQMTGSVIDSTFGTVDQLSREVDTLRMENDELRRSVHVPPPHGQDEDFFFLEGAAWMGRKVMEASDRLYERMSSISLDYQQQSQIDSVRSPSRQRRSDESFSQRIDFHIDAYRQKLRKLFEKVLVSIEDHSDAADGANSRS